MTDTFILNSFDEAQMRCGEGYSTDGGTGIGAKKIRVKCGQYGMFSQTIKPKEMCQPVRCDKSQLMTIANAYVTNEKEDFYEYGDKVEFKCSTGYTISGKVGSTSSFEIPCQDDGKFPSKTPSCYR